LSAFENLLAQLDEMRVPATLFVIANDAALSEQGARLLRRAVAAGHEIGNHGLADAGMSAMSEAVFDASVAEWERRMRRVLGTWPPRRGDRRWFRPAKGLMSAAMAEVLQRRGYHVSLPDTWSSDSTIVDPAFHASALANAPCDGSVLLMHAPDPSWGAQITDVLPIVVPILRSRGFVFAGMSEMFAATGGPSSARLALGAATLSGVALALLCCLGGACSLCLRGARPRAHAKVDEGTALADWPRTDNLQPFLGGDSSPAGELEISPREGL